MNLLLIPIAAFMAIVALLILKEIRPDTLFKKLLKVIIMLLFIIAFGIVYYFIGNN